MASPPPPPDHPRPTDTSLTPPSKRVKTENSDTTEPFPNFTDTELPAEMANYGTPGNPAPTTEGQPSILPTTTQQLVSRVQALETTLATGATELQSLRERVETLERAQGNGATGTTAEFSSDTDGGNYNNIGASSDAIARSRSQSANLINVTFILASEAVRGTTLPTTPDTPGLARESQWEFTLRSDDTLAGVTELVAGKIGRRVGELGLRVQRAGARGVGIAYAGYTAAEMGLGEGSIIVVGLGLGR